MENISKITILLLLVILPLSSFSFAGDAEELEEEYQKAKELGKSFGNYDGIYHEDIPTVEEILLEYERYIKNQDSWYQKYFIEGYYIGFEDSFNNNDIDEQLDEVITEYDCGYYDGKNFGHTVGTIDGIMDYFEDRKKDYRRNIPSNKKIEEQYGLDRDGNEYKKGFIDGFKLYYEESYNESFSSIKADENISSYKSGYESGIVAGINKGRTHAMQDYYLNIENNWRKYYPMDKTLIREYNLEIEDKYYEFGFIGGYLVGFLEGYQTTYQNLHNDTILERVATESIPVSGGEITTQDELFSIFIDKGIYYNPVIVSIATLTDGYRNTTDLIKASNIYSLNILSKSKEYDKEKPIEIKFEYYGKENGGIYELIGDEWTYIPSEIEGEYISAKIDPSKFHDTTNIYGVFIDNEYNILLDVRNHWAKEEIIAFQRRGIISGYPDKTFRPEQAITKKEFFEILKKTGTSLYSKITNVLEIDGQLILKDQISFYEMETLIKQGINSLDFKWESVAAKILYERQYKSKSYYNMNNYITRAEVVYMLYYIH